jgi:hypothetical protein
MTHPTTVQVPVTRRFSASAAPTQGGWTKILDGLATTLG